MPSYNPPIRATEYIFYVSLTSQANTKIHQTNPTFAPGDVLVAIDDGAPASLATLPVVDADLPKRVKVVVSAAETDGDNVSVLFSDLAGDEWCDATFNLQPVAEAALTAAELPGAADIWAHHTRTLTDLAAAWAGEALALVRGVTFGANLSGLPIPATWTQIFFSVKSAPSSSDSTAAVQIKVSNPADAGDGLLYLAGAAAANAGDGALVVDDAAGTVGIVLADDATTLLAQGAYGYDIKALLADGTSVLVTEGSLAVRLTETETI